MSTANERTGFSKERAKTKEEILQSLAELGGKLGGGDEDILFQGTKLIVPETWNLQDVIDAARAKQEEDGQVMSFSRVFKYRPWDGARATINALRRQFGFVAQRGIPSFFGEMPPELRTINVDVDETEQVPWGRLNMSLGKGESVDLYLAATHDPELGKLFAISAEAPRSARHVIEGIFNLVENELKENSLYRGKAFDGQEEPQFVDLRGVDPSKIVYSEKVLEELETNVWTLLRYTDRLRADGESLKRAVVFGGPYGTGKTEGAKLTAKLAIKNGWTFIYCRPGRDDLFATMATARLYQPAVVFMEDVDVISSADETENHIAKLLDVFDGVQAKNTEIVVMMTTNHPENIHKGMLRPGRIDSVIEIGALDRGATERLVRAVVPTERLEDDIDFDAVYESMQMFVPAYQREAISRAVRYNLSRGKGVRSKLSTDDLVKAALGLQPQLRLMEEAEDKRERKSLDEAIGSLVGAVVSEHLSATDVLSTTGERIGALSNGNNQ